MKNQIAEPETVKESFDLALPARLSKRIILRQIASIYDPLGLITPFTLKVKFLMREFVLSTGTEERLGWDDAIDSNEYNK